MFTKYDLELEKIHQAHISTSKKIYSSLRSVTADWDDSVSKHLIFDPPKKAEIFTNLKDWSDSYNSFDNWVNLNYIMAANSNLETYISVIVQLALESDPGLIFGASKLFDGVRLLKYPPRRKFSFVAEIESCTIGDWNSRANSFEKLFGKAPEKNSRQYRQARGNT
jgi:hypothetical protein